jgi:FAD dependent oxidoreductase.
MGHSFVDYAVIGAGIYGLFAANLLREKGYSVAIIEMDPEPLTRASYVNQARVHNGYHYPRSVTTAAKSSHYYERFNRDFQFAVHRKFSKIYAISAYDSLTNADQFIKFCRYVNIPAEEINPGKFFRKGTVEAAFLTDEYTYDAEKIRNWYMDKLSGQKKIQLYLNSRVTQGYIEGDRFLIHLSNGQRILSPNVLNATYAGINQIHELFGLEPFKTKYELCEVILTKTGDELSDVGITVMDGPFFSIMPFGLTGYHSLTAVSYTPHEASTGHLPEFTCQSGRGDCNKQILQNCNTCHVRPRSAWPNMSQLAKKYLNDNLKFEYKKSLFTVKTILNSAELDDSRPTVIRTFSDQPKFISVFSGKFNTIYDLEEVLP